MYESFIKVLILSICYEQGVCLKLNLNFVIAVYCFLQQSTFSKDMSVNKTADSETTQTLNVIIKGYHTFVKWRFELLCRRANKLARSFLRMTEAAQLP